jgi:hypothetical protein
MSLKFPREGNNNKLTCRRKLKKNKNLRQIFDESKYCVFIFGMNFDQSAQITAGQAFYNDKKEFID